VGLDASVGLGFLTSPRPYIGADSQSFPIPIVNIKYRRWFLESIRGGYAFVQRERLDARAFTQVRFQGLEPDSSPFLEGMETRQRSLDAGVEVIYRERPVGFRVSAQSDVLGRSNGQEASAAAITGAPLGKALVLVGFGPRWLSRDRVNYYYGVRTSEARPGRPQYSAPSTINWDLTVTTIYNPTPRWTVFGLLTREGLGSSIRSSPLVERTSAYSLIAFVSYKF
jgi:outer membrane protein